MLHGYCNTLPAPCAAATSRLTAHSLYDHLLNPSVMLATAQECMCAKVDESTLSRRMLRRY